MYIFLQIDLRFESKCLEQFVKNFEENPHIRFPRPIWPYCKRAVMVETYEVSKCTTPIRLEEIHFPACIKHIP